METLQYPTETKAIKDHRCNYCCLPIIKGDTYLKSTYKYDTVYSWKSHLSCSEIANKLKMFDNCDEGLTADDFREIISNEYHVITEVNPVFSKPPIPFSERLDLVLKHHGISTPINLD